MQRRAAFTLLEMSIVLAIIAVIMGGGLAMFSASLEKRQLDETNMKLAAIQKALLSYRIVNNRIPCPADITADYASQYFGVEAAYTNCYNLAINYFTGFALRKSPIPLTPNYYYSPVLMVAGMVPTRTLGLPDDSAIDGWGRRIFYVVDPRFTLTNAFTTIPVTDITLRIWIEASTGGAIKTKYAGYVLISFGPNGHGGWPRNAPSGTITRISANSANTYEQTNCHCDNTGAEATFSKIFVQKPPTQNPTNILDSFDDVVVYGTRADLRSPKE
jgi:prepilin-type N-terminal cleavage/methylation domain-containing protein